MPSPKRTSNVRVTQAPKSASAPPVKGPSQETLLLAALAVADDGSTVVSFAAYGEVMARQADLEGVTVENVPGVGVQITANWAGEQDDVDDASDDVEAVQAVTKSAYTPAGPAAPSGVRPSPTPGAEAPKVGPAVDRPSLIRHDALTNTRA